MAVNDLIIFRKGTDTQWSFTDPILSSGEPGFDVTNNILKIGDGSNNWSNLSAVATSNIQTQVKNTTGQNLSKGQAVYINGADGNNPTIALSVASGESTSSKTLGLLKQDLANNAFGYVISEGFLEGIDTDSAGSAGDPMWLSPTTPGGILYGLSNKPSAPYHMVFLGYVLRKQQNNGKIYIKIQNGFELEELHNVAVSGVTNGQFLQYNSSSSLWVPSSSGNFTTLQVNGTGVSVSGHSHTSLSISDFNSSVSGLLPVKDIIAGSGVTITSLNGSYTINSVSSSGGGGGGSGSGSVTIPGLGDLSYSNVSLLLHGDGSNGSTTFSDSSSNPKTITIGAGSPQISTTQSKFGGSSIYLPVSTISTSSSSDFAFGTGNFTVEFWWYVVTLPSSEARLVNFGGDAGYQYLNLTYGFSSNTFTIVNENVAHILNTSQAVSLNQWHHIAYTRSSDTLYLFFNGALLGTASVGGISTPTTSVSISSGPDGTSYFDDIRITKGVARYTSSFSPPTAVFADASSLTLPVSGLTGGGTTIANYGDNRILTSDGTSTGINSESSLTFDGALLTVPSGSFTNSIAIGSRTLTSTNTLNIINSTNLYLWSTFR